MRTDKYLMPPMSPGGVFMIEKMIEITAVTYHQRNTPALFNKQFANRDLIELFKVSRLVFKIFWISSGLTLVIILENQGRFRFYCFLHLLVALITSTTTKRQS